MRVKCTQTTVNYRGAAHATVLRVVGSFVEWVGLESPSAAASAVTSGYSGVTGTHILYCDYSHTADLEVLAPDTLRIHNSGASVNPAVGTVTLIW